MENNSSIRVVVDTNIWISLLIGRKLGNLLSILDKPNLELIGTDILFQEVAEVTQREKFSKYFSKEDVKKLLQWMHNKMTTVELNSEIPSRCRDAKDDYLLELAVQANAIYLVSGDDDLLSFGQIKGCRIMTVAQFEQEIENV